MNPHPAVGAVVPVKRLGYALGRLASVLDRRQRRVLQSAMLGDVLSALADSTRVREVVVVTSDPRARAIAESVGARTVPDHDPPQGINAAVIRGVEALDSSAALVMVSDLPLVSSAAVDAFINSAPSADGVLLASSLDGTGTNAMLIRPPHALVPELGEDSLARHLAQASAGGVGALVREIPGIGLRVPPPADLAALISARPGGATGRALHRLGMDAGIPRATG